MKIRPAKTAAPSLKRRKLPASLFKLSEARQDRLDELMTRNNNGSLNDAEKTELRALVMEAEAIALENARAMDGHRRRS